MFIDFEQNDKILEKTVSVMFVIENKIKCFIVFLRFPRLHSASQMGEGSGSAAAATGRSALAAATHATLLRAGEGFAAADIRRPGKLATKLPKVK